MEGRLALYLVRVPRWASACFRKCGASPCKSPITSLFVDTLFYCLAMHSLAATTTATAAGRREPASNLADNLLRDFEQRWWGAVKRVGARQHPSTASAKPHFTGVESG